MVHRAATRVHRLVRRGRRGPARVQPGPGGAIRHGPRRGGTRARPRRQQGQHLGLVALPVGAGQAGFHEIRRHGAEGHRHAVAAAEPQDRESLDDPEWQEREDGSSWLDSQPDLILVKSSHPNASDEYRMDRRIARPGRGLGLHDQVGNYDISRRLREIPHENLNHGSGMREWHCAFA